MNTLYKVDSDHSVDFEMVQTLLERMYLCVERKDHKILRDIVNSSDFRAIPCLRYNTKVIYGKAACPLHLAVSLGDEESVFILLNAGLPVNGKMKCGATPLHFSGENFKKVIVYHLMRMGAHLSLRMRDYKMRSYVELSSKSAKSYINFLYENQFSFEGILQSLHVATEYNDKIRVERVLNSIDQEDFRAHIQSPSFHSKLHYESPMHLAARHGRLEILRTLHLFGFPIDVLAKLDDSDYCIVTPLQCAIAKTPQLEVLEYLLQNGASVNEFKYYMGYKDVKQLVDIEGLETVKEILIKYNAYHDRPEDDDGVDEDSDKENEVRIT